MKVTKDNKVKLAKNEKRLGNFVIKNEEEHVKITDINGIFSHRFRKSVPVGAFLEMTYKGVKDEETSKGLRNYIAVLYAVSSTVPDKQWLEDVYNASVECMERHPEVYGYPRGEVSDGEDAKILEEEKELSGFVESLPDVPEDAS